MTPADGGGNDVALPTTGLALLRRQPTALLAGG